MGNRRASWLKSAVILAVIALLWTTLVAAAGSETVSLTAAPAAEEPAAEAPAAEEPAAEEPAAEVSAAEEPAAEQLPAGDEPDAEESLPVEEPVEELAGDEPAAEELPAGDEPDAEESLPVEEPVEELARDVPAAEEPPPVDEPATEDVPASGEPSSGAATAADASPAGQQPVAAPTVDTPNAAQPPAEVESIAEVADPHPAAADPLPADGAPRAVALLTTLTTRKFTDPPRASDSFPFDLTGPSFADSFSIAHGGSHTSTLPGAGSYTLTETVPSGWRLVDIDCTNGSVKTTSGGASSITLTVVSGERWDCVVTDQQLATIVIEKAVDFDDDTAFAFTGELGDFVIDPDGTTGTKTFPNLDPNSSFTITETVPGGWDLTGISCSDKSSSTTSTITIDPAPGGTTTCTFTNQAQEGTITVVKEASPADGTDFPFTIEAGRLPDPFTLDDDADPTLPDREAFDRAPGTWTVTEAPPFGWEVASISCTNGQTAGVGTTAIDVALGAGGDVTCTFTNRRQPATIVIEKAVDFDDGTAFDFTGDLGAFAIDPNGLRGSRTFTNLDPDADYTIIETVPAGWDFVSVECSDKSSSTTSTITIDPAPGGTTTCTFTNEAQQGTVTVVKVADPVDGTKFAFGGDLGAFTLVAESEPPPPDPGPPERSPQPRSQHAQTFTVDPGSYDVVEDVPSGWVLRSVECVGAGGGDDGSGRAAHTGVTVTVGPGEDVTCTFANVKPGTLTIAKDAEPADGTRFPVTVSEDLPGRPGGLVASFELVHGGAETLADLPPSSYVIAEDPPAGWGLSSVDCGGAAVVAGAAPNSAIVTVGGGDDVRCTLENRKAAQITIAKEADVDDGTLFPFSGDLGDFFLTSSPAGGGDERRIWARQEAPPSLPPTGDGQLAFTVDPGTFVVTEGELAGWDLASIACVGGKTSTGGSPGPRARAIPANSVEITVAAGDVVECVFSNRARSGSLTIRKEADPADGTGFDFTFAPGEGEQSFTLRDGEEERFSELRPGTYRVVEKPPAGWGVGEIDCGPAEAAIDGTAGTVDVTVGPGKDVTCVFRNTDTATITIVKDASPADGTDFTFSGDLGSFALDVETVPPPEGGGEENGGGPAPQPRQTGEENLPDRMTFSVAGGSYTVTEDDNPAWELVAIDCGDAPAPPGKPPPDPRAITTEDLPKRSVTIDVAPGESVTCIFRNRPRPVKLTLIKQTHPTSSTAFDVQVIPAGGSPVAVQLRDGEQQTLEVAVGDVAITEQLPAGWGLRDAQCTSPASVDRALASVSLTTQPGVDETCTIVNARTARVTIRKLAAPLASTTFGFAGDFGVFTLTVPAPPPPPPTGEGGSETEGAEVGPAARQTGEPGKPGPDEATFEVDDGTYRVTEDATAGWELVAITCSGIPVNPRPDPPTPRAEAGSSATPDVAARALTLTVRPGDTVDCTFENRQVRRGLTIVKRTLPAGGSGFPFRLDDGGPRGPVSFTLADGGVESFEVAGKVTVTETVPAGWDLTAIECDVAGADVDLAAGTLTIELPAGAAATCTFTDTRRGSVTVIKSAAPADGTDFPFELAGKDVARKFALDDGADGDAVGNRITIDGLRPGGYSLTEIVPSGWALRDVSCRGAVKQSRSGSRVEIELGPGGGVICTFTNGRLGSLRGELFLDLNGNGTKDAGEPDLADVEVAALFAGFDGEFGTGDDETFTTRSVAGNSYSFAALPPGKYRVSATPPARLAPTRAVAFEVEIAPGQAVGGAAFAFAGADLELSVVADTTSPKATQPFGVTVTVTNRGPQPAGGVAVRVTPSAGLRVNSAKGDGAFDVASGIWTVGDLAVGASKTLVLSVTAERAGSAVQVVAEVSASSLLDPDSTPDNAAVGEDDQGATSTFTVGVAPTELLPVTGLESGDLVRPGLVFLLGGLILVLAGRAGRRREDAAPPAGHPVVGA